MSNLIIWNPESGSSSTAEDEELKLTLTTNQVELSECLGIFYEQTIVLEGAL